MKPELSTLLEDSLSSTNKCKSASRQALCINICVQASGSYQGVKLFSLTDRPPSYQVDKAHRSMRLGFLKIS
jgi:hypothetical protein